MKIKRIAAILLLIAVISTVFLSACSSNSNQNNNRNQEQQTSNEESIGETQDPLAPENIFSGVETQTYDGKQFNILAREKMMPEFYSEEENGEIINDAVFKRNLMVEDTFDVNINVINMGEWNEQTIRKSVTAGEGAYDLVDGYAAYVGNVVVSNLYLNLLDVPHLRLKEAWWSQHAVDELTINGNLYIVPGDITINLWETIMTVFFSKRILEDFNLENPYTLVKEGKWTLDKMIEMSKGVSDDINGDGKMDTQDRYGTLIYDDLTFNNFHNAFDIPTTLKDSAGIPYFNLESPSVLELAEIMFNLASSTDGVTYSSKADGLKSLCTHPYPIVDTSYEMFANSQILFYPSILGDAEKLRSMETDFGILPYPKKTAEQPQYKTSSRDQHTMFGIPIDVKDVDFVGRITEALCVASNKIVIPTYYDIALKSKYTRDDESAEMLDLIRQGLNFDFGIVFSSQINSAGWVIRSCINQTSFNFASSLEKSMNAHQKALDKFLSAFE